MLENHLDEMKHPVLIKILLLITEFQNKSLELSTIVLILGCVETQDFASQRYVSQHISTQFCDWSISIKIRLFLKNELDFTLNEINV